MHENGMKGRFTKAFVKNFNGVTVGHDVKI